MIAAAMDQASAASQRGEASAPILARLEVSWTSGTTANGSCIDSTTWLRTSSRAVPDSPATAATIAAGTTASERVTRRRSHGATCQSRKPSITTCPASVAVTVEFWPEASSATANSVEAAPAPSAGASRR